MKASSHFLISVVLLVLVQACAPVSAPDQVATGVAATLTAHPPADAAALRTVTPKVTAPPRPTHKASPSPRATGGGSIAPHVGALSCPDNGPSHDNTIFHALWDSQRGCHYDHEHGQSPFVPDVAAAFPGFDLRALLCDNEVGHCVPTSEMENTHKHPGFKWQVDIDAPRGCELGFEGGTVAIDAYSILYHAFGVNAVEFESRFHSQVALLRQCKPDNLSDKGYLFVDQHGDYGQVVIPYQGTVMPYPNAPSPGYASGLGPYFTDDCVGPVAQCRSSLQLIRDRNLNVNSTWTSKSAHRVAPSGSTLIAILFRVRDSYQVFDWNDQEHPFTYRFVCGNAVYNPIGCRWNNTTTTVHEVQVTIPASWDNLAGFDTDPRVGRITAEGYTTRFGQLNQTCTAPGANCHPIKMVNAFVGFSSSELSAAKVSNPTPLDTPERDIYFCSGVVCAEGDPGAVPSGWVGQNN